MHVSEANKSTHTFIRFLKWSISETFFYFWDRLNCIVLKTCLFVFRLLDISVHWIFSVGFALFIVNYAAPACNSAFPMCFLDQFSMLLLEKKIRIFFCGLNLLKNVISCKVEEMQDWKNKHRWFELHHVTSTMWSYHISWYSVCLSNFILFVLYLLLDYVDWKGFITCKHWKVHL